MVQVFSPIDFLVKFLVILIQISFVGASFQSDWFSGVILSDIDSDIICWCKFSVWRKLVDNLSWQRRTILHREKFSNNAMSWWWWQCSCTERLSHTVQFWRSRWQCFGIYPLFVPHFLQYFPIYHSGLKSFGIGYWLHHNSLMDPQIFL